MFKTAILEGLCIFVVMGHIAFVSGVLDELGGSQCLILGLEMDLQKLEQTWNQEWTRGYTLIVSKELCDVMLHDHCCGGATDTDGSIQSRFGHALGSDTFRGHMPDVQHLLRHYLECGTKGHFKRV